MGSLREGSSGCSGPGQGGQCPGTTRSAQRTGAPLQIGTNKVYGAIHQFGGTIVPRSYPALVFKLDGRLYFARKVTIPARPFLGVSAEDRQMVMEVVEDVLSGSTTGRD